MAQDGRWPRRANPHASEKDREESGLPTTADLRATYVSRLIRRRSSVMRARSGVDGS